MFVMWNYDFRIGAQSTLAIIISISIYAFWRISQEGISNTERNKLIGISGGYRKIIRDIMLGLVAGTLFIGITTL